MQVFVMMLSPTCLVHDMVHFFNHTMVMSGSMMDDGVQLVDKHVVRDGLVDAIHVHLRGQVVVQDFLNVIHPSKVLTVHLPNVGIQSLAELFGMNVFLEDGEDLVEQLLLMQVVELQGGVHLVDDGVLVDKSWKLAHDSRN